MTPQVPIQWQDRQKALAMHLAHDMRTNLASIQGIGQLLAMGALSTTEQFVEYGTGLTDNAMSMNDGLVELFGIVGISKSVTTLEVHPLKSFLVRLSQSSIQGLRSAVPDHLSDALVCEDLRPALARLELFVSRIQEPESISVLTVDAALDRIEIKWSGVLSAHSDWLSDWAQNQLALCAFWLERMEAQLFVDCKGGRFGLALHLPNPLQEIPGVELPLVQSNEQFRILLADDELYYAESLAVYLTDRGCEVVTVADGWNAVVQFQRSGPFDVVLVNMDMPLMDGNEAAIRILRQSPQTPILAISAASNNSRTYTARFAQILTKPLSYDKVYEAICKHVLEKKAVELC